MLLELGRELVDQHQHGRACRRQKSLDDIVVLFASKTTSLLGVISEFRGIKLLQHVYMVRSIEAIIHVRILYRGR